MTGEERSEEATGLGALIELASEKRRLRRMLEDLPAYRNCDDAQEERRDVLDRRLSRLDDEFSDIATIVIIQTLQARLS
jgi:polyhydroxyalkanoate synthesis regulator phasin